MNNTGKADKREKLTSAEEFYIHTAKLLQKYDSLCESPKEGFKNKENPSGYFEDLAAAIIKALDKLFIQSDKDSFFWYDCPLTVYKSTLKDRLANLKENSNPSLSLKELLLYDYKVFDVIPLYGQRVLRTDRKELNQFQSLDYGRILKKDFFSKDREILAAQVRDKLEQDRKKKMKFIQEHFQEEGKWITKTGTDFKIIDLPTADKIIKVSDPYPFANGGFKLFNFLLENSISKGRGRKSDIAYYYWRMHNDENKYIYVRPEPFKTWFSGEYQEELGKFKTLLQIENTTRNKEYSRAIEWLKAQ